MFDIYIKVLNSNNDATILKVLSFKITLVLNAKYLLILHAQFHCFFAASNCVYQGGAQTSWLLVLWSAWRVLSFLIQKWRGLTGNQTRGCCCIIRRDVNLLGCPYYLLCQTYNGTIYLVMQHEFSEFQPWLSPSLPTWICWKYFFSIRIMKRH